MMYGKDAIDDQTLETLCAQFMRTAIGGPDTAWGIARERNLTAYNGEAVGDFAPPEVADRSDFVATDVADTVHGLLPQLMRIFVSSDDAVEFEAKKPGGEQLAKTVTAYINHLFYVRNDGLNVLYDWFHDALIQKVAHVMVWAEEEAEDERAVYEGLTEDQVAMLMEDGAQIDGEPMVAEDGTLTLAVRSEQRRMCIKVAAVAPHEMRIDPNARWGDEPAAIGRKFLKRCFELKEDGYDLSETAEGDAAHSSTEALEMLGEADDWATHELHDSHRMLECAELYMKLDRDCDGVAEWLKVFMIGDKIAIKDGEPDVEQVDDHPFCEICPQPRPHSYVGDCPADFAYQAQKHNTNLTRALLDSLYLSVSPRTYVNTKAGVNIDDLLDARPNGIVRGERPMTDALAPLVQPNVGAPAYQMLELMERWRENRTGFNRYSAGSDEGALNKTARGMELLTSKADMRTELIARFFAQGVRKMFAKMLKLAVRHQNAQEWFQVAGEFVAVNPSEWRDQFNVRINVGLGHGSKEQQAARVMAMVPMLQMGQQAGVVRPEHIGNAIRLFATTQEFKNPDEFADPAPQGPPPEVQQMQQQMQEMGQQLQQAEMAAKSKDGELQVKHREIDLKERELGIREFEAQANVDLQAQANARSDRETNMKGAETEQRLRKGEDEESRLDTIEQQVAALIALVGQLLPQSASGNDAPGMDAPAASFEGGL
jgi:hypothetical protein